MNQSRDKIPFDWKPCFLSLSLSVPLSLSFSSFFTFCFFFSFSLFASHSRLLICRVERASNATIRPCMIWFQCDDAIPLSSCTGTTWTTFNRELDIGGHSPPVSSFNWSCPTRQWRINNVKEHERWTVVVKQRCLGQTGKNSTKSFVRYWVRDPVNRNVSERMLRSPITIIDTQ